MVLVYRVLPHGMLVWCWSIECCLMGCWYGAGLYSVASWGVRMVLVYRVLPHGMLVWCWSIECCPMGCWYGAGL